MVCEAAFVIARAAMMMVLLGSNEGLGCIEAKGNKQEREERGEIERQTGRVKQSAEA